jgi:aminoglycoside phosphotransferase (APT) family kinase protein
VADTVEELSSRLAAVLAPTLGETVEIRDLRRLTGGASRETWSFEAAHAGGTDELILRRAPAGSPALKASTELMLLEAAAMREAARVGVPEPELLAAGGDASELGAPFIVMRRVAGETIGRRILRDDTYAPARGKIAAQCGAILAALHTMDPAAVVGAADLDPLEALRMMFTDTQVVSPTLELAFRWLSLNRPETTSKVVVHGDFRLGNLIIDDAGVAAVLDWELVHLGDPMEDLGWLCVRAWRFGAAAPVAGVGSYDELFTAYEHASGQSVDRTAARWWELYGTVRWGVICILQANRHLSGAERSVELAAIGRRLCEQEYDALGLLEELIAGPVGSGTYGAA